MTLTELGLEYAEQEKLLTKQIKDFIPKVATMTGIEKHQGNRRMLCLYEMRREVRITADTLKNYYTNKSEHRVYHRNGQ